MLVLLSGGLEEILTRVLLLRSVARRSRPGPRPRAVGRRGFCESPPPPRRRNKISRWGASFNNIITIIHTEYEFGLIELFALPGIVESCVRNTDALHLKYFKVVCGRVYTHSPSQYVKLEA